MIKPQQGEALYWQLAATLREAIRSGRIRPGQMLPSERSLGEEHGISRDTIRRAIAVLRAEGLVVVRQGHGVLVRDLDEREDLILAAGSTAIARMPTADERARYELGDGVPVLEVTEPGGGTAIHPADRWRLRLR